MCLLGLSLLESFPHVSSTSSKGSRRIDNTKLLEEAASDEESPERVDDERVQHRGLGKSKNISRKGPRNCRSLHGTPGQVGCARDDKGKSDAFIESGCWTEA
jgi:hypothetical protein